MQQEEKVLVLVKAVPRRSKQHGETVCCAGVTLDRKWRRLYPVRFRQLGENKFKRWDWLRYRCRLPTSDSRKESRHVFEDTFIVCKKMSSRERSDFLEPLVVGAVREAVGRGESLSIVRPIETRFHWKKKKETVIAAEKEEYVSAAKQGDFFDAELAALDPSPYDFRLSFRDEDGWHHHSCSDWETAAAYWKHRNQYGEERALRHLDHQYNEVYPREGMMVALGTMLRRPRTWILLGIIRVNRPSMGRLFP